MKIGLPGKWILGDYFQENRTSQRPFLLLRISFPGRLIFIQLPPVRQVRRLSVRFLPREPEFHDVQVQEVPGSLQQPHWNPESHREGPQGSGVLRLDRLVDNFHPSKSKCCV